MSGSKKVNYVDQPQLDEVIPLNKAAEISELSSDHLRRLVREGELWGMKIGRNWVTSIKAVKAYLARNRKPGPKPHKAPGKNK